MTDDVPVILLAEDQPDDVTLMRLAMETAGLRNRLFTGCDGKDAVDYLDGNGPYENRRTYPIPGLALVGFENAIDGRLRSARLASTTPAL